MPTCNQAPAEILTRARTVQPSILPSANAARGDGLQEMPYAVWTLSHAQHHRVVCQIKGQRHEIERVRAEPRLADEKSPAHLAAVILEVNLPAVCPARQPSPRHFYLRRCARCDVRHKCTQSPKPRGHEASRRFDALG